MCPFSSTFVPSESSLKLTPSNGINSYTSYPPWPENSSYESHSDGLSTLEDSYQASKCRSVFTYGNGPLAAASKKIFKKAKESRRPYKEKVIAREEQVEEDSNCEGCHRNFTKYYTVYFYKIISNDCHQILRRYFRSLSPRIRSRFLDLLVLIRKCTTWASVRFYAEIEAYLDVEERKHSIVKAHFQVFVGRTGSLPTRDKVKDFLAKYSIDIEAVRQNFVENAEDAREAIVVLAKFVDFIVSFEDVRDHWLSKSAMKGERKQKIREIVEDHSKQAMLSNEFLENVME